MIHAGTTGGDCRLGTVRRTAVAVREKEFARYAEQTARNIDRLVAVTPIWGGRFDGWLAPVLYRSASEKLKNRPVSLVVAEALVRLVGEGDSVILVDHFACPPRMPYGETDGPPGVASLARAISVGLSGVPVLVTGPRDIEVARHTVRAAGLDVMPCERAARREGVAGEVVFPITDDAESRNAANVILDRCAPKAVVSVETVGPNRKGVRHLGTGHDAESEGPLPHLEHLFTEARARGILTIGIIDRGNEIGGGTIEEAVRKTTPHADVCLCPCGAGVACSVETDIVFPASISNWGAYAVSAMLAFLLKNLSVLQDDETERRMLEACVAAGAVDSAFGKPVLAVDGTELKGQQAIVNLLRVIIENALRLPRQQAE